MGEILEKTRHLTTKLSYPVLSLYGFEQAIRKWSEQEIQSKHGIDVRVQDDGQAKPLSQDVKAVLFRGVRELLTNVTKHARASTVKIQINRRDDMIEVIVADDGVGLAEKVGENFTGDGFGIMSVVEAIEGLGGHLQYQSEAGQGCTARIVAPLALGSTRK